jgi:integrase
MARRGHNEGSIYRRTDGYWVGCLQLGYDTGSGKRQRKYFYGATRREVQERLAKALADHRKGLLLPDDRLTLEQYLTTIWLPSVEASLRPRAYEAYELNVRRLVPHLGRVRLAKLTPAAILRCYAELLAEPGMKGRPLSARSVRSAHTVLHNALHHAVKWELIPRNPTDAVSAPRPARREMKTLSAEQARTLFAASSDNQFHALWLLFATTGLRMGEATALRWRDMDLERGAAKIQRALQRHRGVGLVFVEPKTELSRRTVYLPPITVSALAVHQLRQAAERTQAHEHRARWADEDLVFCTTVGTPLDPARVREAFHQALERAGLPDLRPHDLRHTAATLLLELGVNPKIVQDLLGHSTITLTLNTYSHVNPALSASVAARMNELFPSPAVPTGVTVESEPEKS